MPSGSAQVVILGAGRSRPRRAAVGDGRHRRARPRPRLAARRVRGARRPPTSAFVGGYRAEDVVERYPQLRVVFNRDVGRDRAGRVARPRARSTRSGTTYVCYSDVVFRRARGASARAPRRTASRSRSTRSGARRYDGREPARPRRAPRRCGSRTATVAEIGAGVDTDAADAEFAGVLRLAPPAVAAALAGRSSPATLAPTAALPDARSTSSAPPALDVTRSTSRGDWAELDAQQDLARFVLGTKAESLERLQRDGPRRARSARSCRSRAPTGAPTRDAILDRDRWPSSPASG